MPCLSAAAHDEVQSEHKQIAWTDVSTHVRGVLLGRESSSVTKGFTETSDKEQSVANYQFLSRTTGRNEKSTYTDLVPLFLRNHHR